jgi:hypothetical protein
VRRILAAAACALVAGACVRPPAASLPAPASDWVEVLSFAQTAAAARDYAGADSALAAFARRRADTPEAREAAFWRAVINLDPRNPERDAVVARTALERYVSDTAAGWPHGPQARALLSLVTAADSLDGAARLARAAADSVREAPAEPPKSSAREEELQKEVQRLKEQLERTNAELDLIRKRLTAPRRPAGSAAGATRP